ncbi:unnamed protein product, partial [Dicrocoelium dendriticum]
KMAISTNLQTTALRTFPRRGYANVATVVLIDDDSFALSMSTSLMKTVYSDAPGYRFLQIFYKLCF